MKYLNILFLLLNVHLCIAQNTFFSKAYDYEGGIGFAKAITSLDENSFAFMSAGRQVNGHGEILVYKVNMYGDVSWTFSYREHGFKFLGGDMITLPDGLLIYCTKQSLGSALSDFFLLKISLTGELLWTKIYDLTPDDAVKSFIKTQDGSFLLTGYCRPNGLHTKAKACLFKLDAQGNLLWTRTYGEDNVACHGSAILQIAENEYMFLAVHNYSGSTGRAWLIKTDSLGNKTWDKKYGSEYFDYAMDMLLTEDKGFIVVGYQDPTEHPITDGWIFRVDSLGNLLWDKAYGTNKSDAFEKILRLPSGNIGVMGLTRSYNEPSNKVRIWLLELAETGDTIKTMFYESGSPADDQAKDFLIAPDGGYIFCGSTHVINNQDAWVMKTDSSGNVCKSANCDSRVTAIEPVLPTNTFSIYPNPTKGLLNIPTTIKKGMLTIYDMTGKVLLNQQIQQGNNTITLDIPNGTYLIALTSQAKTWHQKLVIMK